MVSFRSFRFVVSVFSTCHVGVVDTDSDDTEEQSLFAVILCCKDPLVFSSSQSDDSFTLFIDGNSISVDSMPVSIEAVAGEPPQIHSHNS